ncbi:hypothetical protein Trydic_g5217, partial [Trypoxylus dichotomus]
IPPIYPDFKQYGRQNADLAQEHWLSQKDSAYSKTQLTAARYLGIKPIVDTISEDKKYGNEAEFRRNIAIGIMSYIDAAGALINNIVDLPFQKKDRIVRVGNAALDAIGSKIVGI